MKEQLWKVIGERQLIKKHYYVLCRCTCGKEKMVRVISLGKDSFGCASCMSAKATHRASSSKLSGVWGGMKQRCYYPKHMEYKNYGARGIRVCDEWKGSCAAFIKWAKQNGYKEGLSLDRINNDGNYSPENCRWATKAEQCKNQRTNIKVTINNKTLILKDWCREFNLNYDKVRHRIYSGLTPKEALEFCKQNIITRKAS